MSYDLFKRIIENNNIISDQRTIINLIKTDLHRCDIDTAIERLKLLEK